MNRCGCSSGELILGGHGKNCARDETDPSPVHIIIPARLHSTRFPGKALAQIDGRPMILHVLDMARMVACADTVSVATDSEEIYDVVEEADGKVWMTDDSFRTGTDRVASVAKQYHSNDIIVNVQCDLPFFNPKVVTLLVNTLKRFRHVRIATPVIKKSFKKLKPGSVMVVADHNRNALYFSRNLIPFSKFSEPRWVHIGIYAYRNFILQALTSLEQTELELSEGLEQLRALESGYKIRLVPTIHDCGPDINYPHDTHAGLVLPGIDTAEDACGKTI